MKQKKELFFDLEATNSAKEIVQTYEEIAATRLMSARGSVAQTRAFLDEIAVISQHVRKAYDRWRRHVKGKGKKKDTLLSQLPSTLQKNGKIARVLLSANRGLYGDLPVRIVREFIKQYQADTYREIQTRVDVVAVGRVGQYLLDNPPIGIKPIAYKAFALDDDQPKETEIKAILEYVLAYDRVIVTYAKFQSLLSLKAETVDITGADDSIDMDAKEKLQRQLEKDLKGDEEKDLESDRILFEPSITKVAAFFETEILKALLRQKIYEMQLARFASRMVAMDLAENNAFQRLLELKSDERKLKRKIMNKKLQQIFAGSKLWQDESSAL